MNEVRDTDHARAGVPAGLLPDDEGLTLADLLAPLVEARRLLLALPVVLAVVTYAATFLMQPVYTSRTVFMPPQPAPNAAASALASLGSLAGLAPGGAGRTSADQYVALLQSTTVADRLIDELNLMQVYEAKLRSDARRVLGGNTRVSVGKKDGLVTVDVDDHDPQRAAAIANRYVVELRNLSSTLALTEAQQRRVFFESQVKQARDQLTKAQQALQGSGFNPGALKSEPRAVAEAYATLQAQTRAAEIRLEVLRRTLMDTAPEVQQQVAVLTALRSDLSRAERPTTSERDADYVARFREFKYQEALFESLSRQFELSRLDESRDSGLIQVVDSAMPADRRSSPKRTLTALLTAVGGTVLTVIVLVLRDLWRGSLNANGRPPGAVRIRIALGVTPDGRG